MYPLSEYYLTIERSEVLIHETTWTLKVLLTERSQTHQRQMISFHLYDVQNRQILRDIIFACSFQGWENRIQWEETENYFKGRLCVCELEKMLKN